jgi:hypothetical protein
MKISKRSNGSYVLRVSQVEATINGSQSVKEVYELYEKLIRLVGDGQELKKIEVPKDQKVEGETTYDIRFPEPAPQSHDRTQMMLDLLKKHGELKSSQLQELAKIPDDTHHAWSGVVVSAFKSKKVRRKKDKKDGKFIYFLK